MRKAMSNRVALLGAVALGLAILGSVALGAQEKGKPAGPAPTPERRPMAGWSVKESLGLTPEQEKALESFRKARQEEAQAFRDEMMKLGRELDELAKDPKANESKINALIDKRAKLRAEREKAAFKNRLAWEKIFTPEQLEKMKTFRGRLMDRYWMGHPAWRGMGPGRGMPAGPGRGWAMGPGAGMRGMIRGMILRHRPLARWLWRW